MILLDTHVFFWRVQASDVRVQSCIACLDARAPGEVAISVISLWEIARLRKAGRVELPVPMEEWLRRIRAGGHIRVLPLNADVAIAAAEMDSLHRDPADRFLMATAMIRDCILVTEDQKILDHGQVRAIRCAQLATTLSNEAYQ